MRFERRLERLPAAATIGCCLLLLIGIGAIDYLTGPNLSLSIFYLVPISWVAWTVGKKAGLSFSVIGAAIWLAADLAWRTSADWGAPCWNSAVRLGFFSIVSLLLAYLRSARDSVEGAVRSQTASLESEILQHKRTETELGRVTRVLRALIDCNQIIVRATSEGKLLEDICRLIVGQPGYCMAWVGFAQQDDAKSIRPAAYAGDGADYLQTARLSWGDDERTRGPVGTAIRTGVPCMIRDIKNDPRFPLWREQAIKHGYVSGLGLPLSIEGHVIGALTIYSREPDAFGDLEQSLLVEMTQDLAYGIASLRRRADRDRAEAKLREIEMRLRMVVESSMDAIVAVDERARIAVFNASAEQLFGYSAQEAIGAPISLLLRQPAAEAHQGRVERFLGHGVGQCGHIGRRTEFEFRRKDGTTFTGEIAMSGSRSTETRLVVVSIHDITERKQAEAALRREQEFSHALLQSATDGIVACDVNGTLALFNQTACEWHGMDALALPPEEWARHYDLYETDGQTPLATEAIPLARAFRGETIRNVGMAIVAKGQPPRFILASGGPFFDAQGRKLGAVVTMRDITEYRRAQESLQESQERFRTLFEGAFDGIALADMETKRLSLANPGFCRMTGYSAEEVGRLTVADLHPPEALEEIMRGFEAQARGETPLAAERPVRRKDGSVFYADIAARPVQVGGQWHMVGVFRDVTERKRAEEAIRQSEERYRMLVESVTDYIYTVQVEDGKAVGTTHGLGCVGVTGYTSAEYQADDQLWLRMVLPEDRPAVLEQSRRLVAGQQVEPLEHRITHKDGSIRWVRDAAVSRRNSQGRVTGYEGMVKDITDRKTLEQQFLQAQKMEAIGRLAGGMAHDFRNQLTVIKGYGEMILRRSCLDKESREEMQEILKAAGRSATLANELLAFSRQEILQPEVINLDELLAGMSKPLARMIGEDIHLSIVSCRKLGNVRIDPVEFQHAITNLAVNARDAMPQGGWLSIETANVDVDEASVGQHPGAAAGPYVMVAVSDSGVGMDRETREKIFEPFFTTKPVGQGTGLGLSMVYGFVKQAGGHVCVYSEPGHGTIFKLYFPRVTEAARPAPEPAGPTALAKGRGTILVVEDEDAVRRFVVRTLEETGYTVLEATSPATGISLGEQHGGQIDLLITDVVMPDMNGPTLADRIRAVRAGIPVIFISGYTGDVLSRHGPAEKDVKLLVKPFGTDLLVDMVHDVLRGPSRPEGPEQQPSG